jgi:hypothetical protein
MDKDSLQNQLKDLPQEIKKFISSALYTEQINNISKEAELTPEQKTAFENEVLFVLLGMELKEDLGNNIKNQLTIDDEKLENIIINVNTAIFEPVLDWLPLEEEGDLEQSSTENIVPPIESTATTTFEKGDTDIEPTNKVEAEKPTFTNIPNYSDYDSGKDPYREPIE